MCIRDRYEFDKNKVRFISYNEKIDTRDASGKLLMYVISIVAEIERDNISENIKLAKRQEFESGKATARKVLGYDIINKQLVINKKEHSCYLYDKNVDLTPIEFEILLYLMTNKGKVVSSEELFEKVWKEKYFDSNNTVMVHIRRIREKLGEDTKRPKFIKTIWGVGYKIED